MKGVERGARESERGAERDNGTERGWGATRVDEEKHSFCSLSHATHHTPGAISKKAAEG